MGSLKIGVVTIVQQENKFLSLFRQEKITPHGRQELFVSKISMIYFNHRNKRPILHSNNYF
jgi:hypothetical protein